MNPGRDIGNSHVHGITATDEASASRFSALAPSLTESVQVRAIVAHNAPIDLSFLEVELLRAQVTPALLPPTGP